MPGHFFADSRHSWYVVSRYLWYDATDCVPRTQPWYACFYGGDLQFETRFYDMKYFGNTNNLVDSKVLKLGA
jgi:hypothetical protein